MVKGIAIIAVVLGHIHYDDGGVAWLPLSSMLGWSWHVAMFFMISGFFLTDEKLCDTMNFIRNKLKALWIPLLCYVALATIFHNLFVNIGFLDSEPYTFIGAWKQFCKVFIAAGYDYLYPLWFVRSMIYAFILLALISLAMKKIKDNKQREIIRFGVIMTSAAISTYFSAKQGVTLQPYSNVPTALLLIYAGYIVNRIVKIKFDNATAFVMCMTMAYYLTIMHGTVDINTNTFSCDIFGLMAISFSYLYVLCYISKKITGTIIGCLLEKCGQASYHIMALHPLAFKCGAAALLLANVSPRLLLNQPHPECGSNALLVLYYLFLGVMLPCACYYAFKAIKDRMIITKLKQNR